MAAETTLRRRGRPAPRTDDSMTTELTSETTTEPSPAPSSAAAPTGPVKSVPELIAEESKAMANFVMLAGVIALFFGFMIQTTQLPPPGRVYGVMIDAGSTGTRAQVFTFRRDAESKALVLDDTKMFSIKKSVAALAAGTAGSGTAFFKPLLENVKKAVPGMRRRKRTPIALRATAGLRLIGDALAEMALSQARQALNASEFLFREEWVSVLEEEDEAAHAWTTVNYLMGKLHPREKDDDDIEDFGALELGGGSMQIVYKQDKDNKNAAQSDDAAESEDAAYATSRSADTRVNVFGKSYQLHSTSHLGLGLFDFTKKLYTLFDREGVLEEGNPCFRKDKVFEKKALRFGVPGSEESRVVTMTGDGDFERCVASAEITIATFSNLYDAKDKLPSGRQFYAFAYFYDRTVGLGLPATPSKRQLVAKGKQLCEMDPDVPVRGDFDEACAEFSYIYAVLKFLTNDFSSSEGVHVRFEQFVDGHMLGWALGAMLETIQPVMQQQLSLDTESLVMT